MAFGKHGVDEDEYPPSMAWKGTERSAREVCDWARDEALIPFSAVSPPDRNAKPGTPESKYRLKLQVAVPPAQGGGVQWVDVPEGSTINHSGTRVDPVFTYEPPSVRQAAGTFQES